MKLTKYYAVVRGWDGVGWVGGVGVGGLGVQGHYEPGAELMIPHRTLSTTSVSSLTQYHSNWLS